MLWWRWCVEHLDDPAEEPSIAAVALALLRSSRGLAATPDDDEPVDAHDVSPR